MMFALMVSKAAGNFPYPYFIYLDNTRLTSADGYEW